jgi:hypothetical protein
MSLPGSGAAFYKWCDVSIRLMKGAFSFLSAHLLSPLSGALEYLQ